MAAAMNGLALHGGIVPYGGTFLVFTDYCRPSIRLSALMGQRVIYVMTHDLDRARRGRPDPSAGRASCGAPRHAQSQCDAARPTRSNAPSAGRSRFSPRHTPSILALTRQGVPVLRKADSEENLSAKGAYVLIEPQGGRDVTLLATGSEVALAVDAAEQSKEEGIKAAVVSMPCWELFEAQSEAYRNEVLGTAPRVGCGGRVQSLAGENGSVRKEPLSACTDLALRLRRKNYISISASRPMR